MRPTARRSKDGCAGPAAARAAEMQRVAPTRSEADPLRVGRCTAHPTCISSTQGATASAAPMGDSDTATVTTTFKVRLEQSR